MNLFDTVDFDKNGKQCRCVCFFIKFFSKLNYLFFKGLIDRDEYSKKMGEEYDENKFNIADTDNDGKLSFKGEFLFSFE